MPRTARSERRAHFGPWDEILSEKNFALESPSKKRVITPMLAPEFTTPEPPRARSPAFTIASWIVPAIGGLLTFLIYERAAARRVDEEIMSGLDRLVAAAFLTAFLTFLCGLMAFVRRERNRWLAILPFLISLGILLFLGTNYLLHHHGS